MSEEQQRDRSAVVEELSSLGQKLGAAIRAVIESPQRYEVEQDVRDGFRLVINEVNAALAKARATEAAKEVGDQAEKVVETVRSSKLSQEVREGLLKGLKALNTELDELVDRLERQKEEPVAPEAPAETETPPAEGEVL